MNKYYSGLVVNVFEEIPGPLNGRGWKVTTEPVLQSENFCTRPIAGDEIVIHAASASRAQYALSIILDVETVIQGVVPWGDELTVIPADLNERRDWQCKHFIPSECSSTASLPLTCLIASKVSQKRKYVYAFSLCRQSIALQSTESVDLDPALYPYNQRTLNPRDHVRFSYSIVTAYAALEQLGLSLHGECFKNGKWIEAKRDDLLKRLLNAGVVVDEPVLWMMRGGVSGLEEKRPPSILRKCSWSRGQIRDCEVDIVDAIGDLRWLRSRVAAHEIDTLASRISIHDVSNAQLLVRRTILESIGFTIERIRDLRTWYGHKTA